MTLSRKILWKNTAILAGLALLGVAALIGLIGLRNDVLVALDEYNELRIIEQTGLHVGIAKGLMTADHWNTELMISELRSATGLLQQFADPEAYLDDGGDPHEKEEAELATLTVQRLTTLKELLLDDDGTEVSHDAQLVAIEQILADLNSLSSGMDVFVAKTRMQATDRLFITTVMLGVLSLVVILAAIAVSISQYRNVMNPLRRLREGVRNIATGRFTDRLGTDGEQEFSELAGEFNRMAEELDGLYRGLEEKVITKSKELVRSERLASVGFLAAGVAHEINNPLNIISGYAELSLKQLRRAGTETPEINDAEQALQIIREEAFRCKQITEKLLSLAKPGTGNREPLSLAHVAEEISVMVRGLKQYRDRKLVIDAAHSDDLVVSANETEMKQVVLNLAVNAMESCKPGVGEVHIRGIRNNGWVELIVQDNGCGMSPETLERVFEPFFSAKGGTGRGVGLGMSISHAIIESHGGQIRAESDGPGRGSRFVIRMPAQSPGEGV